MGLTSPQRRLLILKQWLELGGRAASWSCRAEGKWGLSGGHPGKALSSPRDREHAHARGCLATARAVLPKGETALVALHSPGFHTYSLSCSRRS